MIAKTGLGLIGLSAISIGGVAVTKPHWLGMDYMPKWHSLSEDNGFNTSSHSGKFAEKYTKYLVGATHKKDKTKETNQAWWEWSFRRLEKDRKSGNPKPAYKFANANNYGTGSDAINKVCEDAYKADSTDVTDTGEENKFKKSDVWKYCSPGQLSTTSKDEGTHDDKKIGWENTNKTVLVSVKDSSNDWFWKIRDEDFWASTGNWSGSGASGTEDTDKSIFKKEYEANNATGNKDKRKTIKDLCKQAYDTNKKTEGTDNNNTDAKKFCALEASS